MSDSIPASFFNMLERADVSWHAVLRTGLEAIARTSPDYLSALAKDDFLPNGGRLFAAFRQPMDAVKYVLVGEGPYPRPDSATGVCFMDGAVGSLWSEKGLSKQVNRATSLRNFMKMLLVADGQLSMEQTTGDAMETVSANARVAPDRIIQTLPELEANLTAQGFLLLNASLVFRTHVAPAKDAKAWLPFLQIVLSALADNAEVKGRTPPTLVLWGKIAVQLDALPTNARFPRRVAEHPYNLSFIGNQSMQDFFAPMHLLQK
ncbi:MAG: uracil-DNA glycosylase [Oxalicibacterium faecigallinarum]|uniref:uracil-DNA glycosylase n=1 Tax=Oxalicibacterium faecigallinarum TaxID=573741 RepID=UPI002806F235|nr:uracil-DNA glycosylase [Oxalicibacterium faecigallinarum]MDQ7968570.1 uracil-DNA glycosylase [Oxalicibacterium faecigallinarum]